MILSVEFKAADDVSGLERFQHNLLVRRDDNVLVHGEWDGKRFQDYELGLPIAGAKEYAVLDLPYLATRSPL